MTTPPTRWAQAGPANAYYGERFAGLLASGADIDGEARLADAVLPRRGRALDAGAGMGRVSAYLIAQGHDVVAIEPDHALVEQAHRTYPDLAVLESDILDLVPAELGTFDLVVCVGNVMVFLAEGTEQRVLRTFAELLAPGGRLLVGFNLTDLPINARAYPPEEFEADAVAAGLRVDLRAGSYDLRPPSEAYGVWLLSRA